MDVLLFCYTIHGNTQRCEDIILSLMSLWFCRYIVQFPVVTDPPILCVLLSSVPLPDTCHSIVACLSFYK